MIKDDVSDFINDDFAVKTIYSNNGYNKEIEVIFDHDVELFGYTGDMVCKVTVFTFASNDSVVIGGVFTWINKEYIVDDILSNDGSIMSVSVVKR